MTAQSKVPFGIGEHVSFAARVAIAAPVVYAIGDELQGVAVGAEFVIDTISAPDANGLIEITFAGGGGTSTTTPLVAEEWVMFSKATSAPVWDTVSYTLSNVEMILQQLEMPQGYTQKMMSMMKEGGSMNYDFLSFTNFKYSQLASDIVANIRLPLNMTRAKAILSVATDATSYPTHERISGTGTYETFKSKADNTTPNLLDSSDKSGLVGISDFLTEYQFFYDGKLNPSRKVSCSETSSQVSISQQPLIELEKALVMAGIVPYSFREFQNNFVIGRALSLHNGVYNTQGKDFNLQLEYTGGGTNIPTKNKLWANFVAHLRRIVFTGDGIRLEI
jgi:hypothetical protein